MLTQTLDFCVKTVALIILLNLASNGLADSNLQARSEPFNSQKNKAEFVPPKGAGIPKGPTTAGGTRPNPCNDIYYCFAPLMPNAFNSLDNSLNYYALTTSERPTFFVNVPKISGTGIFTLYQYLPSSEVKKIYRFSFPIATSGGIIGITLPSSAPLLQNDSTYEWNLAINSESVNGLVRRVQLNPSLMEKISRAKASEKLAIYAAEGIWYDSLQTLAELRTSEPQNPKVFAEWSDFLKSVRIDKFANQNFVSCCTAKN